MDIRRHKTQGFTLIEVIVVVIAVGILAIYPLIKWPGSIVNLDGQAESLAGDIRYAQSLSMTKGQNYQFIRTAANTYQITTTSGTPVILGNGSNIARLNSGITFGTLTNMPNSLIAFNGQGVPYTDSSITTALSSTATIPLTASGNTKTVIIRPETGSVDIQ